MDSLMCPFVLLVLSVWQSPHQFMKVKVTWHTAKYGDPYSEFVLCIYPIQSAHTQQWTHTQSSGQPFMLWCPGSSWGFGALLKGTSVVVLRVERALVIHSPHLQFLPARDSNSQPLGYESDSLTIRPRLIQIRSNIFSFLLNPVSLYALKCNVELMGHKCL